MCVCVCVCMPVLVLTLLEQHHASKPIVQIPQVHRRHAPLIVQIPVHIKRLIRLDLHLPHPLPGHSPLPSALIRAASAHTAQAAGLVQRRVELVAPGRAVAVTVAVVVAQQVVSARLLAAADGEGLVDRRQQVLGQVGRERDDVVEVLGRVLGVEAAEEVAGGLRVRYRGEDTGWRGRYWSWEGGGGRKGALLTAPSRRGLRSPFCMCDVGLLGYRSGRLGPGSGW